MFPGVILGVASPHYPPTAGCSINLSAQSSAPFAEGFLASAVSTLSVRPFPQWSTGWKSRLLSCLALAVLCIFSSLVIPQTGGKQLKVSRF